MNDQLDPSVHEWTKYERLILFDGVCKWCNAWVSFTIAHDPDGQFKFGTLQSEQAQRILCDLHLSVTDYQTFLLLEEGPCLYQVHCGAEGDSTAFPGGGLCIISVCWCLPQSAMWSMISSRVTGISGWAERLLVGSRLRQSVSDLSEHGYRHARVADVSYHLCSCGA